jgi:exodeoxyribonuclease VII large subunit
MNQPLFSVTELNRSARAALETAFKRVQVEGEISELLQHRSGHWYFTLKDESAQLRAAMFKFSNRQVTFNPENGQQVILTGKLSIYEARGSYQFIAEQMSPAGLGKLQIAFDALKEKLATEGLFASEHKQPLPNWPQQIAVVTSPQGAAIRDIQSTFARRFPAIELLVVPVAVQGAGAGELIAQALQRINSLTGKHNGISPDAIIVARGGGSLEDLWAFNEEVVARAIFDSALPVISAVGHETDITIADFVADARAATPTAAAELLSPDSVALSQHFAQFAAKLSQLSSQQLKYAQLSLRAAAARLRHPGELLTQRAQQLDYLDTRLRAVALQTVNAQQSCWQSLNNRLLQASPAAELKQLHTRLKTNQQRMQRSAAQIMQRAEQRWQSTSAALHLVSPLATLERGYAIVRDEQGEVVRHSNAVKVGQRIEAKLGHGELDCVVEKIIEPTAR